MFVISISALFLSFVVAMFWATKQRDSFFDFLLFVHILVIVISGLFLVTEKCPSWFLVLVALHSCFYAVKFDSELVKDLLLKIGFFILSVMSFAALALRFS